MSDSLFVKPRSGLKVRDPRVLGHLPESGAKVPRNTYWLRRLKSGDVVEAEPAKQAKE